MRTRTPTRPAGTALGVLTATALALSAGAALPPPAGAADDPQALTLRDSLYLLALGRPAATPECVLVLCPVVETFAPVGSGADAGVAGLRVSGVPLVPGRVVAEARSEPLPYDGAGDAGTASVTLAADRRAEGSGGTLSTSVRLEEAGGAVVAELPPSAVPLDGARHAAGPLPVDLARLVPGRAYVAVARFTVTAPAASSVAAWVYAPRLLALGPPRTPKAASALRAAKPGVSLRGRRLRITAGCPTGPVRCDLAVRASAAGRTLAKGDRDVQAGARHTFTFRLGAAALRRARRAGRIAVAAEVTDERGRSGVARTSVRVPRG
jgi:hypothetical protein